MQLSGGRDYKSPPGTWAARFERRSNGVAPADVPNCCFAELWEKLQPLQQPNELVQTTINFCFPYLRAPENSQLELLAHWPLLAQ
ncbi:hypothetical protein GCM10011383_37960 [Hymenobacter cavernae]|uniref:Uncharacterized protein n=1 Tax=Hymenobacter cavernae TaxID=2044852 RepID=A0ABQ1UQX9_9BACT|nr:hypothetical protein GCM10011383_37960 [Hymenobacter cavernae]